MSSMGSAHSGRAYQEGDRCEECLFWFWASDRHWHSLVPIMYADTPELAVSVRCEYCDPRDSSPSDERASSAASCVPGEPE